jgi:hypothetical protein
MPTPPRGARRGLRDLEQRNGPDLLTTLPRELRDMIYGHLLDIYDPGLQETALVTNIPKGTPNSLPKTAHFSDLEYMGVVSVNKLSEVLYSTSLFHVAHQQDLARSLKSDILHSRCPSRHTSTASKSCCRWGDTTPRRLQRTIARQAWSKTVALKVARRSFTFSSRPTPAPSTHFSSMPSH